MDNKQDFNYEQKRLSDVCREIKSQLKEKNISMENYKQNVIEIRKSMWEETPHVVRELEDANAIEQHLHKLNEEEQKHSFAYKEVRKLEKSLDNPYFARVDFEEDGEDVEELYIGLSTLFDDETKDILIYDWRAPIASVYYDYEIGPASYDCREGKIEGKIHFKRQFKINKCEINYMFDSSIKIDDEILQEILSKSVDEKMQNIVNTIQKEQNRIIRDRENDLLIVQGAAGSGKTSIALHRIAYLLYRDRNKNINSKNIIVFSPNEIFNDYISNVLPELGEENMQQITFYNYASKTLGDEYRVEDVNEQIEYLLTKYDTGNYNKRVESINYKSSHVFMNVIKKYIDYIEKEKIKFDDVVYMGEVIFSKEDLEELFYNSYKSWSIMTRLNKIKERIFHYLKPLQRKRLKEIQEDLKFKVDFEHEIKPLSRLIRYKEYKHLIEYINNMLSLDVIETYKELFSYENLFSRLNDGFESNIDIGFIKKQTVDNIKNRFIAYEDVAPILFLKVELEGNSNMYHIKHVVIDEAQDYTPFQYEIFKRVFKNSQLTVLGDLNQSINPLMNLKDYSHVTKIFDFPKSTLMKLKKSYRSTREIFDFSKKILISEYDIEGIDRKGEKPKLYGFKAKNDMNEAIIKDIVNLEKKRIESIAIICKTAQDSLELYNDLKGSVEVNLVTNEDIKFKRGIVIIPSYLAKGLEFDAVLIYDASKDNYYRENERKLFYTVCTRALHNLNLYYNGEHTPFINDIDTELYNRI